METLNAQEIIGPQEGPQTDFLATPADIAVYGGGAGGGKSFALLLEPIRHYTNPLFGAVIFRRNSTQVRNEGGLWHESLKIYGPAGATPKESLLEWTFPSGMRVKFAHLEYDATVLNYQGAQIPLIGFDELTHFSEAQFTYMLSRNRSTSGVPGYVRATCNPDADSWLRRWLDWWIGKDGFPIKERSGVIRYFIRQNDTLIWGDTKRELEDKYGVDCMPKSFTFISALITDNKKLLEKDPSYLANLKALSRVERERLLGGNWNIRPAAGNYFQREEMEVIDTLPAGYTACVRYWDRAATKPSEENKDPDWTRGLKMVKYPNNTFVVVDLKSMRDRPLAVERLVQTTASQDGVTVQVHGEQDPGSAGVADAGNFTRMLAGYDVRMNKPTQDKVTRAGPVSAQCQAGNVKVLKGPWNDEFFLELENFPDGAHDDIVDALSGAFNVLSGSISTFDCL